MTKDDSPTPWAHHRLNVLRHALSIPEWALLPYQAEMLAKWGAQFQERFRITIINEANIPLKVGRFEESTQFRDAVKRLTFPMRYHTPWQSSILRCQNERSTSPQGLSWRLKPTLQNSTQSGTDFMDLSVPRSHAPLSYLCSLVHLEEKEKPTPPAPLLVDRPPPKKASAIPGRASRAWP